MTSYVSPFTGDVIQPTDVSYAAYTLAANKQLQWPSVANGTQSPAARIMEITAGSGLKLIMPPANQASVGQDALIQNQGANTFTVTDYDDGTICTIAAGEAKYLYLTGNADTAGSWGVIDFGIGTSSPDAATLAGYGLLAISSTLNQSHPVSTFTTGYTFLAADRAQTKLWSGGAGTSTLPDAATIGNNWFFFIKNNGSGSMTVSCTGGNLIAAYGDFGRGYTILDRVGLQVLRDPYTATPYVVFHMSKRTGGAPTNFDSIKLVRAST